MYDGNVTITPRMGAFGTSIDSCASSLQSLIFMVLGIMFGDSGLTVEVSMGFFLLSKVKDSSPSRPPAEIQASFHLGGEGGAAVNVIDAWSTHGEGEEDVPPCCQATPSVHHGRLTSCSDRDRRRAILIPHPAKSGGCPGMSVQFMSPPRTAFSPSSLSSQPSAMGSCSRLSARSMAISSLDLKFQKLSRCVVAMATLCPLISTRATNISRSCLRPCTQWESGGWASLGSIGRNSKTAFYEGGGSPAMGELPPIEHGLAERTPDPFCHEDQSIV